MLNPWLISSLVLSACLSLNAAAQTATKAEALAVVNSLRPIFFGGRTTSASASFDMQNDYIVVENIGFKAQIGQRRRYDPCDGIFTPDSHVKVLDRDTIVATRMGSLRMMIADVSSLVANYTITDVIHRDTISAEWKITYEQVAIWPREPNNEVCNVVRLQ